jgi:hypothetical protein
MHAIAGGKLGDGESLRVLRTFGIRIPHSRQLWSQPCATCNAERTEAGSTVDARILCKARPTARRRSPRIEITRPALALASAATQEFAVLHRSTTALPRGS